MSNEAMQEMNLEQWVHKLHEHHLAHKQYDALRGLVQSGLAYMDSAYRAIRLSGEGPTRMNDLKGIASWIDRARSELADK